MPGKTSRSLTCNNGYQRRDEFAKAPYFFLRGRRFCDGDARLGLIFLFSKRYGRGGNHPGNFFRSQVLPRHFYRPNRLGAAVQYFRPLHRHLPDCAAEHLDQHLSGVCLGGYIPVFYPDSRRCGARQPHFLPFVFCFILPSFPANFYVQDDSAHPCQS